MITYNPNLDQQPVSIEQVGGKAYHLIRLNQIKIGHSKAFNIPKFIVVTSNYLDEQLGSYQGSTDFTNLVLNHQFSQPLSDQINQFIKPGHQYSIRSSGTDEDGLKASFSGGYESFLFVNPDQIITCIKKCYLSAFSNRANQYRIINQLKTTDIKIGVIIQEMIDADFGGVINTINPITNNPDQIVISVIKGTGEKLVSGVSDSSDYYVNDQEVICHGQNILTNQLVFKLVKLANLVQDQASCFQDIEFAIKNNQIYLLQARAISVYQNIDLTKPRIIYDNANIIESYCGVTTPLTFSFIKEVYYLVYLQTLKVGKVRPKIIEKLKPALKSLLAFHNFNVYYNLNSWYYLNSIFPKKDQGVKAMEKMMGVNTQLVKYQRLKLNIIDLLKLGSQLYFKIKNLKSSSEKFIETINRVVIPYLTKDLSNYSNIELLNAYQEIASEVLADFTTPIINDIATMLYYNKLTKKVKKLQINDPDGFVSKHVAKQGSVESTQSIIVFEKIIKYVIDNPQVYADFNQKDPDQLYHSYYQLPVIQDYLTRFGPRVINELKLETITLLEEPQRLFQMIKNALKIPRSYYQETPEPLVVDRKLLKLITKTRYFIKNRESLRLRRTYLFSSIRRIFNQIGTNFYQKGLLDNPRQIYFLEKEMIFDIINNNDQTDLTNLKNHINQNQKLYQKYQNVTTPNRIIFYGDQELVINLTSQDDQGILKGVPSGAGVVEGTVQHVTDPLNCEFKEDVLLTLRTDPGWIVVFSLCKAMIVEHGSILSHSAVVAREMGIPAVVGVKDATKIIKDQSKVIVDGIKGEVRIIE